LTGGVVPDDTALADGHFVEPTVFDDVEPDMTIGCEEIFGPVLAVVPVGSIEEAIEVANDSPYALAASVWTESLEATDVASRLDHGLVAVNTFPVSMPQSPWGGNKESGIGREGGLEGVDAFMTVNSVVVEFDEMEDPY
jgi:aldehyde dehydrogenase (NAD+)